MTPRELHIELTHACPLHCAPCDHRLAGGATLSLPVLRKLFTSSGLEGLSTLSFSGGEPLLHPGLNAAVLAAARSFPKARLIILTGLYEKERLSNFMRRLPPGLTSRLHIGSSLDGPAALHDHIRGRAGAFARLKAAHTFIKNSYPEVSTSFTFTASALNAARFYETWEIATYTLNAPLAIQFLVPNANTAAIEPDIKGKASIAKDIHRVLAAIESSQQARRIYPPESCLSLQYALNILSGKSRPKTACGAGRTFAMLSPEGEFYLCPFHKDIILGSANAGFANFWNEETAVKAFKKAGMASCKRCFLRCAL